MTESATFFGTKIYRDFFSTKFRVLFLIQKIQKSSGTSTSCTTKYQNKTRTLAIKTMYRPWEAVALQMVRPTKHQIGLLVTKQDWLESDDYEFNFNTIPQETLIGCELLVCHVIGNVSGINIEMNLQKTANRGQAGGWLLATKQGWRSKQRRPALNSCGIDW